MSLTVILGFSALLFISASALLWSHWPAWLKAMLICAVTLFYFIGYSALHAIWGLPSTDNLPERFVMLAAFVEEPVKNNPGALYVWVSEIEDGQESVLNPRAYKLPYSRELHTRIDKALERGRDGVSQMGTAKPKKKNLRGKGRGTAWLVPGKDEQEVLLQDLPNPQLPEK